MVVMSLRMPALLERIDAVSMMKLMSTSSHAEYAETWLCCHGDESNSAQRVINVRKETEHRNADMNATNETF